MKRQAGFTLIELVMVIVILGILAAFALPRFADLGSSARAASLDGAYGAVKSASAIAHAEALIKSQTGATGTVTLEGSAINMIFGYPSGVTAGSGGILDAAQITAADYTLAAAAGVVTVQVTGATALATCQFTYTQAADATTPPVITLPVTTGC